MKDMKDIALPAASLSMALFNLFFGAFVAMHLINWFFLSHVGYEIGYWNALGVKVTLGMLCLRGAPRSKEASDTEVLDGTLYVSVYYAIALLIGYAIH